MKIAGVPEHFNFPWQYAITNNLFENTALDWINVPEGTGKICEMLQNNEVDMAVILTEGIIKDLTNNPHSKIIQVYVESPLIWGIHTANDAPYQNISDLENKKIAISRVGSGSQLMAYVNAKNHGWNIENLSFEIVNNLDGGIKSLTAHETDYFMWERFMTKPFVDAGIVRNIGNCPTPWPSFVIVARNEILEKYPEKIDKILNVINDITKNIDNINNYAEQVAEKYHLAVADVKDWLKTTQYSQQQLSEKELETIQNQLIEYKIINKKVTFATLLA